MSRNGQSVPGSRPFEPWEGLEKKLHHLLEELPTKRAASIELLLDIQNEYGHVSPDAEEWVAKALDLPLVKVREVVTFYTMLKERPVGRTHIRVCRNIACALMGAEDLIAHIEKRLGCPSGSRTPDGSLSWETVECLGACEMGPMLQWGEDYHGPLSSKQFDELHEKREGKGG